MLPIAVTMVKPAYTPETMRARLQGTVVLGLVVLSDGTVGEVSVLTPLDPTLDAQAVDAARQWRFTPGTKDGRPVAVRVEIEMQFAVR